MTKKIKNGTIKEYINDNLYINGIKNGYFSISHNNKIYFKCFYVNGIEIEYKEIFNKPIFCITK